MVTKKIKLLYGVSIIIFSIYTIMLINSYAGINEIIVTHLDNNGLPNKIGSKSQLFYITLTNLILIIGIAYGVSNPQIANYNVEITDTNRKSQYKKMQIFLSFLSITVTLVLGFIVLSSIYSLINFIHFLYFISFIPLVAFIAIKRVK